MKPAQHRLTQWPGGVLVPLAIAELMLTLDLSIVNVALPSIRAELGFSESALQWVVNGYALTFAGFLLLGGRASDIFDARRVFLGSLSAFSIASLACGVSSSGPMLVGARVVQGLAAGLLAPTTLSILTRAYQNSEARNRALGIWTAVAIGGGAVGGVIGGLLTSTLAWRWVFFVNVPVGTGLVMAATTRIRPMKRTVKANLDVAGAITVTGSLMAVMWGLARSSSAGWGSTEVITAFAVATTLLAIFAVIELRVARSPLLPFSIFRARSIWAGNLLSFLSFLPVMAIWFFLTLYLQGSRHYTSMQTGLLFLPLSAAVVAGSQVGFRLIRAVNGRMLLAGGGFISAGGLVWLAQLSSSTALVSIISPATLTMAGGGLMFAPITTAATSAPPEQAGLASGLLNTTRQIGGALGLGVLTALATAAGGHQPGPTGGFDLAFKTAALVFAVTALVGLIVLPSARSGRKRQHSSSRRSSRTGKAAPSG